MSYRFKVFFYARKNYVNKDGEVGVMVRISLDGQRTQFSSKLTVKPELWDTKASFVTGDSTFARLINEKLRDIYSVMQLNLCTNFLIPFFPGSPELPKELPNVTKFQ